jgi:teichuronic acid biosynthesis glycosyltransferase TuaG
MKNNMYFYSAAPAEQNSLYRKIDPKGEQKPASLAGLVSVITPAHNEDRYIRRVVESVAAQTVPVHQHIIVVDGSTDNTLKILTEMNNSFPHLMIVLQNRGGAAAARNKGIDLATGRYIAFLDADDIWYPEKLEHQIGFMERNGCLFSYGDYREVDHDNGRAVRSYHLPESFVHADLLRGCPIGCLTAAYNQEVLGKRYMPTVQSAHDWGLWLELTRTGIKASKYPGLDAAYTIGSSSSLSQKKLKKVLNVYRIYRSSEGLSPVSAALRTIEHSLSAAVKKARIIYR